MIFPHPHPQITITRHSKVLLPELLGHVISVSLTLPWFNSLSRPRKEEMDAERQCLDSVTRYSVLYVSNCEIIDHSSCIPRSSEKEKVGRLILANHIQLQKVTI